MDDSYKKTDKEISKLVSSWLKGDKAAFGELYDYYIDNLYRFVYFKVKDEKDVEDLVEIAFLKVFESKNSFNPKKSSFGTWLYNIARNTVIDFYRTKKETVEIPESHSNTGGEDLKGKVDNGLNSDLMKEALGQISEKYRDLVIFRFVEELSYAEVAKILKKKEGTVRVMQYRALAELRDVLEKMGYKYEDF
jgi:RNA polymerase sigma-70 factor (ECF subfamily)